ncbi:hypothetical protein [Candidatus Thioglobus autotrophicus]|uniref:hypothetical protein n=1 Tax=Candidatus Thioglobus autotrophicus TaxID=1705394 RepID=UPI00299D3FF9|nr:hypothetical protein [Candidatus Thioglobus autotrophicus]WPE17901.1 hypothetical protein R5P05_07480 [Candidatus Thioglobus autotrophicus]
MLSFVNIKRILYLVLIVFFVQGCSTAPSKKAETKTVHLTKPSIPVEISDVYWSGFAFLGNYNQRATRYPYTSELINNKKDAIGKYLRNKLSDLSADGFNLHTGKLGDLKPGKGLTMALGISYEDIYVVPFNGKYKASYKIGLNLVVFDFEDKKVITTYPLRFLRNELFDHRPTEMDNRKVIESLYLGDEFNILQESINRMSNVIIRSSYGNYIGIRDVDISSKAFEKIPSNLLSNEIIKTQIAQELEGLLSKNAFTPVVPYTKGEAIAKTMALKIADAKAFNLTLPELDYSIDIKLRDFEKKSRKDYQGYTSSITIKASAGLGEKGNISLSKSSWVLNEMSGNSKSEDWALYEELLSGLLSDFTKQLAVSTSDWTVKRSITKDADKQMEGFRVLIRKSQ